MIGVTRKISLLSDYDHDLAYIYVAKHVLEKHSTGQV